MTLPLRYNTEIYFIVVIVIFVMSNKNCNITDKVLTQRWHKQDVLGT